MKTRDDYLSYHCPRWNEFPDVELYADQVLSVIQRNVDFFADNVEMTFTSNMINNYVKQKIVKPPVNKRYDRVHLAYFTVVCLLKNLFSISEICNGIEFLMKSGNVMELYAIFCDELEAAIRTTFAPTKFPHKANEKISKEIEIIRAACFSFANLVFTKQIINEATK